MLLTTEQVAEKAYKSWCDVTESKDHQANRVPVWSALPDVIKKAWIQSCLTVIELGKRGFIDFTDNTPGEISLFKDEDRQ